MKKIALLGALLALALIVTCYTNPETGRRGLMLIPSAQEAELGFSAFADIKANTPRTTNPDEQALVEKIGKKISGVVNLPNAKWEYVCFKSNEPNAFCLPGGKIGVYNAILPITKNEAGLAAVMGHEVAHATARHGGERMSEQLLVSLGGVALDVALANKPNETRQLAMLAYGAGTTLGRTLPHSRSQELEADRMGLIYMARAGYDPREAVKFWKRFKDYKGSGGSVPAFLSTHPTDDRRIKQLEELMPDAIKEYDKHRGK
ncbi:MAG: M48 family metallopeptidase [Calditrichaeota bacterium]|nr:M48 family metallopeptidase [Calditrichota bacterium]